MMRNLVAGNWKSNKSINDAREWVSEMGEVMDTLPSEVRVMIAPPAPYLGMLAVERHPKLLIAAQQVSATGEGAYTGEYTAEMLVSCDIDYALVGHSERRASYGETNEVVEKKIRQCIDAGLGVVLCCGEPLEVRDANMQENAIETQLANALANVSKAETDKLVIAYEPIWAIGTGRTASADQAQTMHAFIRSWLVSKYDNATASRISILYGGSCKPSNAEEIFSGTDVDGGLIGGASLNPEDFQAIIIADSITVNSTEG